MKASSRIAAVLVVTASIAGGGCGASAQEVRGTLRDVVTGRPLSYGTVELLGPGDAVAARAVTDEDGRFVLSPVTPGSFRMRAGRIDAETVTDGPVLVEGSEPTRLDVLVALSAVELEPIDVTIERTERLTAAGFYQRARTSTGVFMTRSQIDSGLRDSTIDVLERVPEVHVQPRVGPGPAVVLLRGGLIAGSRTASAGSCYPVIYLNGAPVQQGGLGKDGVPLELVLFDLSAISPDEIVGIEVYRSPAETPAQFSGISAACGVIVLWLG